MEDYPQLRKRAKKLRAMIFFLDEAGFQSDPPLGRTYGLKGHTPVVASSGQRQSINVISAVNASGAFWAATYTGKLDAESFVIFLRNFMKGRRTKVFLVVDGHPAHKAKVVKEYVDVYKRQIGGRESHIAGSAFNRPSSFLRITLSSSLLASTSWALSRMRLST